jgi:hypothetical protein
MLQGTVVPAYFDSAQATDLAWSALEQAAATVPIVAVFDDANVLSGVWPQLTAAGVRVFYSNHGAQLLTGLATLFEHQSGKPGQPQTYLKAGLYRKPAATNPDGPYVLFHDEFSRWEQGS